MTGNTEALKLSNTLYELVSDGKQYMYLRDGRVTLAKFNAAETIAALYQSPPVVSLTGLLLFNQPHDLVAGGYVTDTMGLPVSPTLAAADNALTLQFAGINAPNPSYILYRYPYFY